MDNGTKTEVNEIVKGYSIDVNNVRIVASLKIIPLNLYNILGRMD